MHNFQLGDFVVMSAAGKSLFMDRESNPHHLSGVVVHSSPIIVKWDNGHRNAYHNVHLELVNIIEENE